MSTKIRPVVFKVTPPEPPGPAHITPKWEPAGSNAFFNKSDLNYNDTYAIKGLSNDTNLYSITFTGTDSNWSGIFSYTISVNQGDVSNLTFRISDTCTETEWNQSVNISLYFSNTQYGPYTGDISNVYLIKVS